MFSETSIPEEDESPAEVKICFRTKEDGDVTVDAEFERDLTDKDVEFTAAERIAAAVLYRLNRDAETWLIEGETEDDSEDTSA